MYATSDNETDASLDLAGENDGSTTKTQVACSDQTDTESANDTTNGTDTFSGFEVDNSAYYGSGSFCETSIASGSFTAHDDSNLTMDASRAS